MLVKLTLGLIHSPPKDVNLFMRKEKTSGCVIADFAIYMTVSHRYPLRSESSILAPNTNPSLQDILVSVINLKYSQSSTSVEMCSSRNRVVVLCPVINGQFSESDMNTWVRVLVTHKFNSDKQNYWENLTLFWPISLQQDPALKLVCSALLCGKSFQVY